MDKFTKSYCKRGNKIKNYDETAFKIIGTEALHIVFHFLRSVMKNSF